MTTDLISGARLSSFLSLVARFWLVRLKLLCSAHDDSIFPTVSCVLDHVNGP